MTFLNTPGHLLEFCPVLVVFILLGSIYFILPALFFRELFITSPYYYAVPENIHTHSEKGHWKLQGGGGTQKPNFLKESMKQNCNFQRGEGIEPPKNPLWEGYGYFLEQHTVIHCMVASYTLN